MIRPHLYNQTVFILYMPALSCDKMNRSPVDEVHITYCCGKRAHLARALGNECSMVISALGEIKFRRIHSMQAAVK